MQKGVVRQLTEDGEALLRTETYIGGDGLEQGMSRQARLVQALTRQLSGRVQAVRDLSAMADRDVAWVNRLAIGAVERDDAIRTVDAGTGTHWVHTFGAARLDVPDLELYGLSAAQVPAAEQALAHVHGSPARAGPEGRADAAHRRARLPRARARGVAARQPGLARGRQGRPGPRPRAGRPARDAVAPAPLAARPLQEGLRRRAEGPAPESSSSSQSGSTHSPSSPSGRSSPHSSRRRGAPSSGPMARSAVLGLEPPGRPRPVQPAPLAVDGQHLHARLGVQRAARRGSSRRPRDPAATMASAVISSASDRAWAMIGCGGSSVSMIRVIDWAASTMRSEADGQVQQPAQLVGVLELVRRRAGPSPPGRGRGRRSGPR